MLHHISIPAQEPLHVASVLAELFGTGKVVPFTQHQGAYLALALDKYGTFVEVYPADTVLEPGEAQGEVRFGVANTQPKKYAFHANFSVSVDEQTIIAIARREGWKAVRANRHVNNVVEVWVENALMLEFMPPADTQAYCNFFDPHNLARIAATQAQ